DADDNQRAVEAVYQVDVEADAARRAAEQADRDRRMKDRLADITAREGEEKGGWFETARADRAYAAAFRDYGGEVGQDAAEGAARDFRGRAIRVELAAALDNWAGSRRSSDDRDEGWKKLDALARALDPDPLRNRMRDARARDDQAALRELAAS